MSLESHGRIRLRDFAELPAALQGSQSVVSVRGQRGTARVLKRAALGRKLTFQEAQLAVENLKIYRDELRVNGWTLPADSKARIVGGGKAIEVWIIERYVPGTDLAALPFREAVTSKAFTQVVNTIASSECRSSFIAFDGAPELSVMSYGVDLKPTNIIVHSQTGDGYLVDTFPPLNFTQRGTFAFYTPKLHKFTSDMLLAVCATREGSLLRFWRLLERRWNLDAESKRESREIFRETLTSADLSRREIEVILDQIAREYPLLDFYYEFVLPNVAR